MHLEVVTPRGTAVSARVEAVTAPGALGELGVLPGHTPLLAALRAGALRWQEQGQARRLAIGPGFLEVSGADRVVVLADASATPEAISSAKARAELDEVERALKQPGSPAIRLGTPERAELEARRDWALAQLAVAGG